MKSNSFLSGMSRSLSLLAALMAHGRVAQPLPDLQRGQTHDPQMGRYAYRGNPGTKAFQRTAAKRRRVLAHKARAH